MKLIFLSFFDVLVFLNSVVTGDLWRPELVGDPCRSCPSGLGGEWWSLPSLSFRSRWWSFPFMSFWTRRWSLAFLWPVLLKDIHSFQFSALFQGYWASPCTFSEIFYHPVFLLHNSWISREEMPDMDALNSQKGCERSQKCPFLKIKCFLWIPPPLRYGLA